MFEKYNSHSVQNGESLGRDWHRSKIIFLKMGPNNVIEGRESENRDPGARMRVVYAVANVVLENSKITQKHKSLSIPILNATARRYKQILLRNFPIWRLHKKL